VSEQPLTVIENIQQSLLETVISHTTVTQPTHRSQNNERLSLFDM